MLDLLRAFVENVIQEVTVTIPENYKKKERVRQEVQEMIVSRVKSGEITSKEELESFFETLEMSLRALRMVPFEAYKNLGKK